MYVCKILELSVHFWKPNESQDCLWHPEPEYELKHQWKSFLTVRNLKQDQAHEGWGPHGKHSDVQQCAISNYFNPSEYQCSQTDLEFSPYNFYHHSDDSGFFLNNFWVSEGKQITEFYYLQNPGLNKLCKRN